MASAAAVSAASAQPANNDHNNAIDVTALIDGTSADAAYTTVGATADKAAGSNWNNAGPKFNVWFKFTAPVSGRITIIVDRGGSKGTQSRTQLALWGANGITEITSRGSGYNTEDVSIDATALTAGTTYCISVDSYSAATCGTFTLSLQGHPDNDNDGIEDESDMDDDNDGIPDIDEGGGNLIRNGSFEKDDFTNPTTFPNGFTAANGTFIGTNFNTNQVSDWTYDLNLDGWVGGAAYGSQSFAPAYHGRQFMDIIGSTAYTGGARTKFWQSIPTTPGKVYKLSFHWGEDIGNTAGAPVDIIASAIDASNVVLMSRTESIQADGPVGGVVGPKRWYYVEANFTATTAQTKILFTCTQPAGNAGTGADLDLVNVTLADPADQADSDGDGVPDHFDLDSDNDGIFDLVEAGHGATDANMDGVIDGPNSNFGINGLANSVETAPDSYVLNYTIRHSDGDGKRDAADTDSDDDGCPDVTEAGFTDADANGRVDGTGVSARGKVNGSNGYTGTSPIVIDHDRVALICDTDGDGINPSTDLDDDNDGIPDDLELDCDAHFAGSIGTPTVVNGGSPVTEIFSNYNGFWRSSSAAVSPVRPDRSHDLLAFTVNGQTYSTGVANTAMLDMNMDGKYDMIDLNGDLVGDRTIRGTQWKGVVPNAPINGMLVLEGSKNDGNPTVATGMTIGTPGQDQRAYLTDGARSLNLGCGLANIGAQWLFKLPNFDPASLNDGVPDLLVAHIAQISGAHVDFTFYNTLGQVMGKSVRVAETGGFNTVSGLWSQDIYNANGSVFATNQSKEIRLASVDLSETTMTPLQASMVSFMRMDISSTADLAFIAFNAGSLGSLCVDKDTDMDGIPDRLDLDSDNDGIYDCVESGSNVPYTNGVLNGPVNANGIPTAVDANGNGAIDYAVKDSDGDGKYDFTELDADKDGCNDVIEAGYSDADNDGKLGPALLTTDPHTGLVTSGGP